MFGLFDPSQEVFMDISVLGRIQESLVEKRRNLFGWLVGAPEEEKQIRLGDKKAASIQPHLQVLEDCLEETETPSFGICNVCHTAIENELIEMDYTAAVCLGCMSEKDRDKLQVELDFMQTVHRAFLPHEMPSIPGLEIAAFSRPSGTSGGDYFDFFQFNDGANGLAVADAMGHGLSASLLMSNLQAAFRTLAPLSNSPVEVLQRLNHFYLHNVHFTTFATAFMARLSPGSLRLDYSNAGQNPPILIHKGEKSPVWLKPTGAAVGVIEDYQIRSESVELGEGDVLVAYTDGVVEAHNSQGEEFGNQRLAELVQKNASRSVHDMISSLRQGLQNFVAEEPIEDDVTFLAFKVTA
jgi:serine phosphatase RsbU (regulator of sigma subunit)